MRKRVLSLLLVLAMVFSLFPVGVVATGTETTNDTTTDPTFTFTLEPTDHHVPIDSEGKMELKISMSVDSGTANINGFQLNLTGTDVTVDSVTLVDQPMAAGDADGIIAPAVSEKTVYWLDTHNTDSLDPSYAYELTTTPKHVATAVLSVADGYTATKLEDLLAANGAVAVYYNATYNVDANIVYNEATCSHDGDTACEAAHANLGTQWVELTNDNVDGIQDLGSGTFYYYLNGDVADTNGSIIIRNQGDANITNLVICLNGYTLSASGVVPDTSNRSNLFRLWNGSEVTVCNCYEGTDRTATLKNTNTDNSRRQYGMIGELRYDSKLNIYNTVIDGLNTETKNCSAFFLRDATDGNQLTLQNVTIKDFKAAASSGAPGAAILVMQSDKNRVIAKDLIIDNCDTEYGGAIWSAKGSVELENVTARNCDVLGTNNTSQRSVLQINQTGANAMILKGKIDLYDNEYNYIYIPDNGHLTLNGVSADSNFGIRTNTQQMSADAFNAGTWLTTNDTQGDYTMKYYYTDSVAWTLVYDADAAEDKYRLESHYHEADETLNLDGMPFEAWTDPNSLPTSGNWYLTEPVTTSTKTTVASGETLNLCLNGQTVTWKPASTDTAGCVFDVSGTLNIYDCATTVGGFTADYTDYQPKVNGSFAKVNAGATLKLYNGKIYGFNTHGDNTSANATYGTIYLVKGDTTTAGGKFYMYDGEISGNTVGRDGVIYMQGDSTNKGGVFQMEGGKICNNTVGRYGGAVYMGAQGSDATTGAFYMNGGEISGNTSGAFASALYSLGGEIKITGGIIRNNDGTDTTDSRVVVGDGKLQSAMIQVVNSRTLYIQAAEGKEIIIDASGVDEHAIAPMHGTKLYMSGAEVTTKAGYHAIHNQHYADSNKNDVRGKEAVLQLSDVVLNGGVYYYNTVAATFTDVELNGDATFEIAEAGNKASTTTSGYKVIYTSVTLSGNIQMADGNKIILAQGDTLEVDGLQPDSAFTFTVAGVGEEGVTVVEDPAGVTVSDVTTPIIAPATGTTITEWPCQTVKFHNGTEAISVAYVPDTSESAAEGAMKFVLDNAHRHMDGTVYQPWTGVGVEAGNYYLENDVLLDSTQGNNAAWYITSGTYRLCLNGKKLEGNGKATETRRIVICATNSSTSLTIDDCTAYTDEAGVYYAGSITGGYNNYGAGLRIQDGASLTLNEGKITGNQSYIGNDNASTGAGLYVGGSSGSSTFTMNGGEISGNVSPDAGSALGVFKTSSFIMNGGTIKNNRAADEGTIYVQENGKVEINGGEIHDNTAKNGGAIYINAYGADSEVVVAGGQIYNNDAVAVYTTNSETGAKTYSAGGIGGAIYIGGAYADLTISGGTFDNNEGYYGGVLGIDNAKGDIIIEDGIFNENKADQGGVVKIFRYSSTATDRVKTLVVNGGTFTKNSSVGQGGVFSVANNSTVTVNGGTFQENYAKGSGAVYATHNSGSTGASMVITGGTFKGNHSDTYGGVGFSQYGKAVTITGGTFDGNYADHGGAIYFQKGTLTVGAPDDATKVVTFKNNYATVGDGGAIRAGIDTSTTTAYTLTINIYNAIFDGNKATTADEGDGGALYLQTRYAAATDTAEAKEFPVITNVVGCTFTGNVSGYRGGAVYVGSSGGNASFVNGIDLTLEDCEFTENESMAGSVMIVQAYGTEVHVKDCELTNNHATNTNYGAVYKAKSVGAKLYLEGATVIENNTAGSSNVARNVTIDWVDGGNNLMDVSGLTAGARVGYYLNDSEITNNSTFFTEPITNGKQAQIETYLFSDRDGYGIAALTREVTGIDAEGTTSTRLYVVKAAYGNTTPYMTTADAVNASTGNAADGFVKLYDDVEVADLTTDLYLDLNGNNATVTTTGTVYAIDSSTDDYTNTDTDGVYGKLTTTSDLGGYVGSVWENAKDGKRYVQLSEGTNQYSFHRVYLSIYSTLFRTAKNGVGFKARFAADEAVAALINAENGSYGINLNVDGNLNAPGADVAALDEYTFSAGLPNSTPNKLLIAITQILSRTEPFTTGDDIKTRAETNIIGVPYISLNGGAIRIEGNSTSGTEVSLKSMVQAAAEAKVTGTAYTNIQTMINAYSSYFTADSGYDVTWFTQAQS